MIARIDKLPSERPIKTPSAANRPLINAISFDIEEYFHVHAFKDVISPLDWSNYPSRVIESTSRILNLLSQQGVTATFFILGWVADKHPDLVSTISSHGHEIASHGYAHQAVYELSRAEFRDDLARATDAIRRACPNAELAGYRAPSFSINRQTPWAFEELSRAGFCYDSSLSPVTLHDRYGVRGAPRFPYLAHSDIVELPPSTVRIGRHNLAAAGGGHFRLAPLPMTRWAIRRINAEGYPAVSYFHPWEFDPEQPRIVGAAWKSNIRHYLNVGKTEKRLEALLGELSFSRMDVAFQSTLSALDRSPVVLTE